MKLWKIFAFELQHQFRRRSTWFYFITIVGLVTLVVHEITDYARTVENVLLYSPIIVADITGYANKFGLLLVVALAGDGAMRDVQSRMDSLVFTSSVSKFSYLTGRFLASSFIGTLLLILAVPLSMYLATVTQGIEESVLGTFSVSAFMDASCYITLPNVFVATAIVYAVVLSTRNAMTAYIAALALFILSTFTHDLFPGNWTLANLIDPSGINIVSAMTQSLTPVEANTQKLHLTGVLLYNRILWIAIASALLILAFSRFRFAYFVGSKFFRWKKDKLQSEAMTGLSETHPSAISNVVGSFDVKSQIVQVLLIGFRFSKELIFSPFGLMLPAIALYAFVLIPNLTEGPLGVPILPTTLRIASFMDQSSLQVFVMMIITLCAGQLVWRERDTRLSEVSDAVPMSDGLIMTSKLLALQLILLVLTLGLFVSAILIQLAGGNPDLDFPLLLQRMFVFQLFDYILMGFMAIVLHVVINQKYVAHLVFLLFYLYTVIAPRFNIEHKLLVFGSDTGLPISPFHAQSSFIMAWVIFKMYWLGWTLLFAFIAKQFWIRGRDMGMRERITKFKANSKPAHFAASALLILIAGGLIFYNTNILNTYHSTADDVSALVTYERLYSKFKDSPKPQISAMNLDVDFYPSDREAVVNGRYWLVNKTEKSIDTISLSFSRHLKTKNISFSTKSSKILEDDGLSFQMYLLGQSLQPGDSLEMKYELQFRSQGFSNSGIGLSVMNNGSYFRNSEWLPSIGYDDDREIMNASLRKKKNLPPRKVLRALEDQKAVMDPTNREQIRFSAKIGVPENQMGIAPGSLIKSWKEKGRKYFVYHADSPMKNYFDVYAADYSVFKSKEDDIDIQIFHYPEHKLNIETMQHAMKASLIYYTANFGSYPFQQLTFVEYTDPGTGGISLPGTIGYSSNFAFINSRADNRDFDLPFAVTAHEAAHQWWGHQLVPADVEGAAFLSEGLAWYSALNVVEKEHGDQHLENLLSAMRQDFLRPRSRADAPLIRADDDFQGYRKGPLAMYALREYIGEESINKALRNLLHQFKPGRAPFVTSVNLYSELQNVTPDTLHYLLNDLFKTNTFWELETKEANVSKTNSGKWKVTMVIDARKVTVNEIGTESEATMQDYVEVGIRNGNGEIVFLKKVKLVSGQNNVEIEVDVNPAEAEVDPRKLLFDMEYGDNVKRITS